MKVTKEMGVVLAETTLTSREPIALDVAKAPFRLYGAPCGDFTRVPAEITAKIENNDMLPLQATRASGMRVRFKTDSDYIAIHADFTDVEFCLSMSDLATSSFDMYYIKNGKQEFAASFVPSQGRDKNFVESRVFVEEGMKDLVIYFPITATLKNVYVIVREGSEIDFGSEYAHTTPIVFYGSSIVHGIGAAKPSMPYPCQVSRMLDTDIINLGFGGAAKCEPDMIDYIAGLDMSVFVYDYDHNAPDAAYLEATHERGYRQFREQQPTTPIIFASRPDYEWGDVANNEKCRRIVRATYEKAKAEGDQNVYYIDGFTFYPPENRGSFTSDGCHPNDLGYYFMANAFVYILKNLI